MSRAVARAGDRGRDRVLPEGGGGGAGVCAFGARGPARYFGGETALAARIIAAVADLGVESRVGVADGLFAALLAARAASPASAASPDP